MAEIDDRPKGIATDLDALVPARVVAARDITARREAAAVRDFIKNSHV